VIDLYTFRTPNGRKASVMLEEVGLPYAVHVVDIGKGDQFDPAFVAVNPNSKIPAIVDPDGEPITVFESGAILVYLAEKTESPLWPADPRQRHAVLQWLMFQMGGVGPMFGQANHFLKFAKEDVPYGKKRYHDEARRLYGVLDEQLGKTPFLASDYSIADVATYPWVGGHDFHQVDLADYPAVARWFETISARPAVQRGMEVPK